LEGEHIDLPDNSNSPDSPAGWYMIHRINERTDHRRSAHQNRNLHHRDIRYYRQSRYQWIGPRQFRSAHPHGTAHRFDSQAVSGLDTRQFQGSNIDDRDNRL
jgi:hypothetical protein